MKGKASWREMAGILLLAAGIVMLGISVFLCFSNDIWYDELFTMGLASQPLGELVAVTAKDVHPPLYYMIVKLFLELGKAMGSSMDQVVAAKLVSVLPFFLCFGYAVTKIRKDFGLLCAGLFFFLLLSMPQLAGYTVEMRMYGYALFFITAGMIHAYSLAGDRMDPRKSRRQWAALTVYSLAACYTHYFACVAACMIYVYLFLEAMISHRLKQRMKAFLASGLICAAGYLPWLLTVVTAQVENVKESYWIMPLSIRTLGGCVKFLFQPALGKELPSALAAVAIFLLYIVVFVMFLLRSLKRGGQEERRKVLFAIGCAGVLGGIVLFGFVASVLIRPIFVYRYMLPAVGVLWLAFAIAVSELKFDKKICIPVFVFLAVAGIWNYRSFYGEEMWKRVQMEQTKEALGQISPDDILVFNFDQAQGVVSYYLPNEFFLWYGNPEDLICRMYPQNHSLVEGEFEDQEGIRQLKKLLGSGNNVWFFGSGQAREEIIQKWEQEGIKSEEMSDVLLERYWFKIYQLKM